MWPRCCYALALSISWPKQGTEPLTSWKRLLDFEGFRDGRYSVLAAGTFVAMLGQFVPYYYISEHNCTPNAVDKDDNIRRVRI